MDNATAFGAQAEDYSVARPTYPDALFRWIAKNAPGHRLAWDVGTGSGQAARGLAEHFRRVHATDLDGRQIKQSTAHPRIKFLEAPAHVSGLPDHSVDAISAATALHWFDHGPFWEEIGRVSRRGAVFCAWTYHRGRTDEDVQRALIDPIREILAPYWSDGNRLSWRGYSKAELGLPFETMDMPAFECQLRWTPVQIAGFLRSWSAHQRACADGHGETLGRMESDALTVLGQNVRDFVLPLHTIAAVIR